MASAHGFMVVEFGVGSPKIAVARFADLEAEVHIIEGNGEVFFIQAAYFLKDAFEKVDFAIGREKSRNGWGGGLSR